MTEDQQLLNADVQDEFTRIQTDRNKVKSWLGHIRRRISQTSIANLAPGVTAEEIFGILSIKIYDEHIIWDRKVYATFPKFLLGKIQNIIRGIALNAERKLIRKKKKKLKETEGNKLTPYEGQDLADEEADLIAEERRKNNDAEFRDNNSEDLVEEEYSDKEDEEPDYDNLESTVGIKKRKPCVEASITFNINLIDKKLVDDTDPYIKYKDSFTAQFNSGEFGNIVEEILVDPADTELLALYVGKYVEEKKREAIMKEYCWTSKEYNALYRRLLYKLSVCLPGKFKEMMGE